MFFLVKTALSGLIIALVSTIARRYPGIGALIASLPLISVLGMLWLWQETHDPIRMQAHVTATFWYVIPSLPMFLAIPWAMRHGTPFHAALLGGCLLTVVLYLATTIIGRKLGLPL
jgi:MFS-type transporter involved in bile tolerance (Atg22 family)